LGYSHFRKKARGNTWAITNRKQRVGRVGWNTQNEGEWWIKGVSSFVFGSKDYRAKVFGGLAYGA
jgi:hypothetical protein